MSTIVAPCNRCGTEILGYTGSVTSGSDPGFRDLAPYGLVCVPCGTGAVPAGEQLALRIRDARLATEREYGPQDWIDWDAMLQNAIDPHA